MSSSRRVIRACWLTVSVIVTLTPPAVLLTVDHEHFRNNATEVSVLTGLVALSSLIVALAIPTRVSSILSSFGVERVLRGHRRVAVIAAVLVLVHVGTALAGDRRGVRIFDLPSAPRPVWAATISTLALTALVASALRRRRAQPRYEGWRLMHIGLALTVLVFAGLHVAWLGGLLRLPSMRLSYLVLAELAALIVIRRWIWLPIRARKNSYLVDSVRPVGGNAVSVVIRAHGHAGLPFRAGQFAWLKIGSSPFVFEEHPFTIASTAERPHIKEFTIKALGDFSELLIGMRPGRRIYLDGPYGRFTIDDVRSSGFVFIAGGVGITPIMSMLQTLADRRDKSSHLLLIAAHAERDLMMLAELDRLRDRLDLAVVPVVQDHGPYWDGETGRIDARMLDRVLPRRTRHNDHFVCGPPGMVTAVWRQLRNRGIPAKRIHTEQFDVI